MKTILLLTIFITISTAQAQTFEQVSRIGSVNDEPFISSQIDKDGNIYTYGDFEGTIDFDPGPGVLNLVSQGSIDGFISKIDSSGNLLWAKSFGGIGYDQIKSIVIDTSGYIYLAGGFQDTVDFDPGPSNFISFSLGQTDGYISKFDTAGNFIWVKTIGGSNTDILFSLTVDALGNSYSTGTFRDTVDFDPNIGTYNLIGNLSDVFIWKLDASGNLVWAKQFSGPGNGNGWYITLDNLNNIYIAGEYSSICDFDPGLNTYNLTSQGASWDGFLCKLDASGNFQWVKTIEGQSWQRVDKILFDLYGNIVISGFFNNTTDLDPGPGLYNVFCAGSMDRFVVKLNSLGNFVSGKRFGSSGWDQINQMFFDIYGNLYMIGYFEQTVNFSLGTTPYYLTSNGNSDIFVCKLDTAYNVIWGRNIGSSSDDRGFSLNISPTNKYFLTGYFSGTVDFDPSSNTYNLTSAGGKDYFMLNLSPCMNSYSTDTVVACDYLTWINGLTYYTNNNTATYTIVAGTTNGCDSTITLDLTILNSTTAIDTQTTCDSLTWIDNVTYTSSTNTPNFTLTNAAGCDSVVTLNLTILNSSTIDTYTVCDSLTWIDNVTYTSSTNTPTYTLTNIHGCDSVVTLNLTILNSATIDTQTACDSLTWIDNVKYTSSTSTPTFTLTNIHGCDSVVTLNLTIMNTASGIDTQTTCDSLTWIDNITYTSSTNTPTFTLVGGAVNGCDSVVTLNLTILSSATIDTQTACDSLTWLDSVTYTSSTNTPTFTLTNIHGCDSVVTLNLTILNSTTGVDTQIACDSLTWIDNITYTSGTTTPTFILTNAAGCDSVVTLNLTILNSTTGVDTQIACDSLTWIDNVTYTSSTNTPTFTLPNAAGCDSVVTLNLTILNSTTGIDTKVACDSLTWIDGITYTLSTNTPTFNIVGGAANGCDSVVTLNLTINSLNASYTNTDNGGGNYTFTNTSTGSFTQNHWAFGDGTTSTLANPTHTFNANGTYVVVLTINDSTTNNTCMDYYLDTLVVTGVVNPVPCAAGFVMYPDGNNNNVTVVNSSTGNNLTYFWDFGDGDTSTMQFPSHTYATAGPFYLCLTVNDGASCVDTYCDSIGINGVLFNKQTGFSINVIAPPVVVGVDEQGALITDVTIYPNPTTNEFVVELTNFSPSTQINIISVEGKMVYTNSSINTNKINVDAANWSRGIYIVKITDKQSSKVVKLVKQ